MDLRLEMEVYIMIKAIQIQYDESMEELFEYASKAGFKYVSLGFGSSKEFHKDNWKEIVNKIKNWLEKSNLVCVQTHLPYYDLRISSEILDDNMELGIKNCIRASAMLGAKVCVYHPRSAVSKNYSAKVALDDNKKVILGYNEVAKEVGIGLALENLPIFPDIHYMRFYTSDPADLCELVDSFKDENISICWDFGHAHLTKIDHVQALRDVGKRLSCTHIHNNTQLDDDHYPPSMGTMKWNELMPVLNEIGYEGPLTLEVIYPKDTTTESYISHCYSCAEYLEGLM